MVQRHKSPCIHRWVLGEPRMQTVRGVCRRCGARRVYPSGLELPEHIPEYEELDHSRPLLTTEPASLGARSVA